MYLGIDLGTSGVKAVLLDRQGTVPEQFTAPLRGVIPPPDSGASRTRRIGGRRPASRSGSCTVRCCWMPPLAMLAATGLDERHMPALTEGTRPAGCLRPDIAAERGLPAGCIVAGGAGDNAAGAVGISCLAPGQASLSFGTSGVVFAADSAFTPDADRTMHAFCHCLPDKWHRMSVILSAAASPGCSANCTPAMAGLNWAARC